MGCGASAIKPEDSPIAEPDAQAKLIVEGTSAEVKAAAEADATRDGEEWGQLTWPRRQELCNTASATVLQTRTAAQPPAVQALCAQLRALEPPAGHVGAGTLKSGFR